MQNFNFLPGEPIPEKSPLVQRRAVINQRTLQQFMRLNVMAAFITLASTQLLVAAPSHGQSIAATKVTFSVQHESLKSALTRIEHLTEIRFLYNQEQVSTYNNISIPKGTRSVEEQVQLLLAGTPLKYRTVNDHIIIYNPVQDAFLSSMATSIQEEHSISGKVTDTKGNPIIGATIHVSGTTMGATTNTEGVFVIKGLKAGQTYTLIASYIGFEKVTKAITVTQNDQSLSFSLPDGLNPLNEVIVVAYGTQKRGSFTGSAATVKPEAYEGSTRATLQENLQGNVAGVIASNGSGQPGAAPNIRVRGIGSVNAGSAPLYVVDGIPLAATDLAALNNADIESFTVLKDASAASIYGSRAANGVVLITTKKGKSGKTKFNAAAQYGFNKVTLTKDLYPLNTSEMIELLREGAKNAGVTEAKFLSDLKGADVDTTVNTDWFDVLTRQGQFQQYDLSASGGTEKTTFYASGSYYTSKAALEGSEFKRYTGNFKLSNQATDKLSFNLGLQLSYRQMFTQPDEGSNGNPVRMYKRYQPWLRVYNPDGTYDLSYLNNYNPLAVVKENFNATSDYGAVGIASAKYSFTKDLTLENQTSFDFDYNDNKVFYKGGIGTARTNGGVGSYSTVRTLNWVNTSILRYNKSFGEHALNTYLGYEAQKVTASGNSTSMQNFLPGTTTLNNAAVATSGGSSETANSLNSVFANAAYNFKSKYYLSASARRDGSSRFGNKTRFGNFWSVGASWNISDEAFIRSVKSISELRLRTSYGVNGNQDVDNFISRALYSSGDYNLMPGYAFSKFGNDYLTWEKNSPFNVGLDFGLFANRITGTVEYYTRKTSDLLLDFPISATNGTTSLMSNIGEMKNSGWEFTINTQNIVTKNNGFGWNTSFNISTLKNRITSLINPFIKDSYNRYVGGDFYQLYIKGYAGVDRQTGEALWYTDETKTKTTNNYGEAAQYNQGSALPAFFGGLTNTLTWKGINLSFLVFFNYGNKIYDNWGSNANGDGNAGFNGASSLPRYTYLHRWQNVNDITDVPKIDYKGSQSGSSDYNSTRFLYSGNYIRLRDVTLSYNLPQHLLKAAHMSAVRVYARASNLYTYMEDKRMNFDPEVGIDGKTDQNAPMYKTLVLGLDIKF
ncbi:SusC/RagA family TonB-linked outer membrane protein [Chitinophaga silvatica]|uniref:SusC/RagA family TonB-linked outer membrane protein n=1 Tax=Chitinophaga silvatica TaxID=2282649 RepID=A0A3E1Y2L7_9BACT|nr:SusC/RagA family TonB-linked outer membrane protein [Chitinophaga silvatica]RFS18904.1 SusC/RagA family TonB-linked outer membrane protein [Chitinophaga silvatica]